MFNLVIKQRALVMIEDAYEWYEIQKPGLGEEFLSELNGYYKKLESTPEYYGKIKKEYRQISLKRFPFVIVYEIIENDVVVFAVFHTSRNPKNKFKD